LDEANPVVETQPERKRFWFDNGPAGGKFWALSGLCVCVCVCVRARARNAGSGSILSYHS